MGLRMAKMADIRDEHGNPIQLTDEHGNPVVLTDEHGNPVWLTGVATKVGTTLGSLMFGGGGDGEDGGHGCGSDAKASSGGGYCEGEQQLQAHEDGGSSAHVHSTTSGSSSSEDEEESAMRKKSKIKKKGLTQKIKEKLTGGKHKEEQPHPPTRPRPTTPAIKTGSPTTTDRPSEHVTKGVAVENIGVTVPNRGHHTHG